MSGALSLVLLVSLAGLVCGVAYIDIQRRGARRFLSSLLLVSLAMAVIYMALPDSIESKGPLDEVVAVSFCYVAMVLGMFAEYGYSQAERGETRLTFRTIDFLMPIFASPIVFIPLLTIATDVSDGGAFTRQKLMVYLVAFQNGFFWKSFFEQRRQAFKPALLTTETGVGV
jgi:hypothetical protein